MNRKGNMESLSSLSAYLKQISQITLLTREEEVALALRIREGDEKALNELVRRNLRYVVSVSNMYRGCGLSLDDLISEGNIGLIQAAKRFDPDKGVKFITYAVWWIRQAIMHALAEQSGTVRLPIKQAGVLFKIGEEFKRYFQANAKEPSSEELADKLGVTVEDIETIMRVYRTYLSLDTPLKDDDETSYLDLVESENMPSVEENILKASLSEEIEEILEELSPREKSVLRMRFGFEGAPQTLEEIGKVMSLSRERIRQIENKAKSKLRSRAKIKALRNYLN
ncbi:MAG: RNA polymerase sigma factor RpoD/SigA [Candidatus Tectomicrobia bacterium]|uniref:RNA polymerase sigma factor n=1 Tax=Tectimicrobiota bacterium TaxID=2528274 RepID=A0A933GPF2_UNCTE|nr:RNA polymerase sigma factor RpoD/SigA [Candidatus Tectomicrobia bacterium]